MITLTLGNAVQPHLYPARNKTAPYPRNKATSARTVDSMSHTEMSSFCPTTHQLRKPADPFVFLD